MASNSLLLGYYEDTGAVKPAPSKPRMREDPSGSPEPKSKKRKFKPDDECTPEELSKRNKRREKDKIKEEEAEEKRNRPRLIVGVDFGTTYSGIAYTSNAAQDSEIHVLTNWSGGGKQNDVLEKVPSRIAYATENPHLAKDAWGYLKGNLKAYSWFKLLLDDTAKPQDLDDPLLRQCAGQGLLKLPDGKTAEEVTADYLRLLYLHLMKCLKDAIGEITVQETPITFVLTVPATWSPAARDSTRRAANTAGFESRPGDELTMIDEPEAAAISVIKGSKETLRGVELFEKGSCFIMLDMGGGTIDLITYKIVKLDPLQLEEVCVGRAAKCGGTTIDRALHKLMEERYGKAFIDLPPERIGCGSRFMTDFEEIKRDFEAVNPGDIERLRLKLTSLDRNDSSIKGYDFDLDEIHLSQDDLAAMFAEVLTRTDRLVWEQCQGVKKARKGQLKYLVIVGGAGSPPGVLDHYKQFCQSTLKGKVQALRPPKAWSAVCRGACMRGRETTPIRHRLARHHYGIKCHKRFEVGKHSEKDAFMCPKHGKRAANQMEFHIHKGEKLEPGAKREVTCYYSIPKKADASTVVRETLYYSDADQAPTHVAHDSVEEVGIITMKLSSVLKAARKKHKKENRGSASMEVVVNITMTMGSEKGVLMVTAKVGRKQIGNADIQYHSMPPFEGIS